MAELVISLETLSQAYALEIAAQAKKKVWGFKVSGAIFHYGAEFIYQLSAFGKVIADQKLFDVPSVTKNSIRNLLAAGAEIVTIHSSSHYVPGKEEAQHLAGIALLPTMNNDECELIYNCNAIEQTNILAQLMNLNNYQYIVCYGKELQYIKCMPMKKLYFDVIPEWFLGDAATGLETTPHEALIGGADLIVVGKPLVAAENFAEALTRTLEELGDVGA
jgi:orotidine-5'-phosphate decarboxylase